MNLMEMQLSWHSVRKWLNIGRLGFIILRFDFYQYAILLTVAYSSRVYC
jgi:hypothetical protein